MKRLFVLCVLLSLGAAKHTPLPPIGISLSPSTWIVRYSSDVKLSSPWSFFFPAAPGSVNYITTKYTTPLLQSQAVSFTVQIVGHPTFEYGIGPDNPCAYPAHARVYFDKQITAKRCPDVEYTCAGDDARWWSNPIAIELAEGQFTAVTPLTPDQWSNVNGTFGTNYLDGFANALAHPATIGMTFGGGCFFGHGVWTSGGQATFKLLDYHVQ